MASSKATTVDAYLAELPPERRAVVTAVRVVVRRNLPAGYQERMKSCLRFKRIADLQLDAIAKVIASTPPEKFIAQYEASRKR